MSVETNSTPPNSSEEYPGNFYVDLANMIEVANNTPAQDKIVLAGTPEYARAEQQKASEIDPQTRLIEHHYKDSEGRDIIIIGTEHIFDADHPEAQTLKQMVDEQTDPTKKVFILEGQYDDETQLPNDPAEAIKIGGGEFNYMRALARERGIEVVPAEPDPRDTARQILQERTNISRGEIALHYALKTLVGVIKYGETRDLADIAPYIYHAVGMAGDTSEGGWVKNSTSRNDVLHLSDADKTGILAEMPAIIDQLNEEFSKIYPGQKLLSLDESGNVNLLYDLSQSPVPWDPSQKTKIGEISQLDMLVRDRHTFELTLQALAAGKEPVVAVGNSHISTLRPAFEAQFAQVT